jgi:predicted  nucleic acid-binding Zn-ribbon protein
MNGSFKNHVTLVVLGSLLLLAGCKDPEKEKAIADANAAKAALAQAQTELKSVKEQLAAAQKERDDLKTNVGGLTTSLTGVQSQLTTVTQARDQLQDAVKGIPALKDQVTQLGQDKVAALAKATNAENMVADLKSQLKGLTDKITSLTDQNSKLQAALDELKKKIGQINIPGITGQ